jgi:hypothetical protein
MSNPNQDPPHTPGTRKGEEIAHDEGPEPGRKDTGKTGADRPAGTRTGRDSSTASPQEPIDPDSPDMPPS